MFKQGDFITADKLNEVNAQCFKELEPHVNDFCYQTDDKQWTWIEGYNEYFYCTKTQGNLITIKMWSTGSYSYYWPNGGKFQIILYKKNESTQVYEEKNSALVLNPFSDSWSFPSSGIGNYLLKVQAQNATKIAIRDFRATLRIRISPASTENKRGKPLKGRSAIFSADSVDIKGQYITEDLLNAGCIYTDNTV